MASQAAIAQRRAAAMGRLTAATARLTAEAGVEIPAAVPAVGQAELRQVMEIERLAALVESILDATATKGGVDPTMLDGTVAEVKDALAGMDDPAALAMLLATENAGKARKGVLAAIETRQAELEAAEAEDEETDEE